MIQFICALISLGCAIATIIICISMNNEGYDLYKVNSSTVMIVRHSYILERHCSSEEVLSGVSKKDCKQYAKIKGLKIKR